MADTLTFQVQEAPTVVNESLSPDDLDVQTIEKSFILTDKYNDWVKCFLDEEGVYEFTDANGNIVKKKTFGSALWSAAKAYNYDMPRNYSMAGAVGSRNYKKYKHIASLYGEKRGLTHGELIDILARKVKTSDNPGWYDRLERALGRAEIKDQEVPGTIVQTNINVIGDLKKRYGF